MHVSQLIGLHRKGEIEVSLLSVSASENSKLKQFPANATLFSERIASLGWQDLPLTPAPMVIGLTYIGSCFLVSDDNIFEQEISRLWKAVFPKISESASDHLPEGVILDDESIQSESLAKWRNAWCDVISAYSHIRAGGEIFVTNNTKDFQRNAVRLGELGMKQILTPAATVTFLSRPV